VFQSRVPYLAIGGAAGIGFRQLGDLVGWTFDDASFEAWTNSPEFQLLAQSVGKAALRHEAW
jgi:hypothetical protein